ncbi:MAG: hypothetical protein U0T82_04255 [Bacteroidales bacterium]
MLKNVTVNEWGQDGSSAPMEEPIACWLRLQHFPTMEEAAACIKAGINCSIVTRQE